MTESLKNLWAELHVGLSTLVGELEESLPAENLKIICEFIDNREYGIALEWLRKVVDRTSIRLSDNQKHLVQRLAHRMNISLK